MSDSKTPTKTKRASFFTTNEDVPYVKRDPDGHGNFSILPNMERKQNDVCVFFRPWVYDKENPFEPGKTALKGIQVAQGGAIPPSKVVPPMGQPVVVFSPLQQPRDPFSDQTDEKSGATMEDLFAFVHHMFRSRSRRTITGRMARPLYYAYEGLLACRTKLLIRDACTALFLKEKPTPLLNFVSLDQEGLYLRFHFGETEKHGKIYQYNGFLFGTLLVFVTKLFTEAVGRVVGVSQDDMATFVAVRETLSDVIKKLQLEHIHILPPFSDLQENAEYEPKRCIYPHQALSFLKREKVLPPNVEEHLIAFWQHGGTDGKMVNDETVRVVLDERKKSARYILGTTEVCQINYRNAVVAYAEAKGNFHLRDFDLTITVETVQVRVRERENQTEHIFYATKSKRVPPQEEQERGRKNKKRGQRKPQSEEEKAKKKEKKQKDLEAAVERGEIPDTWEYVGTDELGEFQVSLNRKNASLSSRGKPVSTTQESAEKYDWSNVKIVAFKCELTLERSYQKETYPAERCIGEIDTDLSMMDKAGNYLLQVFRHDHTFHGKEVTIFTYTTQATLPKFTSRLPPRNTSPAWERVSGIYVERLGMDKYNRPKKPTNLFDLYHRYRIFLRKKKEEQKKEEARKQGLTTEEGAKEDVKFNAELGY